jgi:UDP-N-acetylglucosamine acyltransferase
MSAAIHPSSIVETGASLGAGVRIGPFCHVGGAARLDDGVELVSHVALAGRTRIGARTKIFPFATIGAVAQDLKSQAGDGGALEIGADCILREGVTVNLGTMIGGGVTCVGAHCALLAYSHVGHDSRLGDHVVLSNAVLLGGHVEIGDHAMIGGGTAVHQYARIGAHAFVGGLAGVEGDVIPFALASGDRAHLFGLNLVGLRRRGFDHARIAALKEAYRRLFPAAPTTDMRARIEALAAEAGANADIHALVEFLRGAGQRPLCAPRRRGA